MSSAAIEALIFVGEFFYALVHHSAAAILMRVSLVIAGRGRWLLPLFIAVLLVAILHDALTGQLRSELQ
jgi:hypothetical protein